MKFIKTIILIIAIKTNIYGQDCLDMDIILLGDYSGSITGKQHLIQKAFLEFSQSFEYSASVRIGIVLFDENQNEILSLTKSDNTVVKEKINSMDCTMGGNTMMSRALEYAYDMLMICL